MSRATRCTCGCDRSVHTDGRGPCFDCTCSEFTAEASPAVLTADIITDEGRSAVTEREQYACRVTLVCDCQNDAAFGRAETVEAARAIAEREFRAHHGSRAHYRQVLIERAIDCAWGGWRYDEVETRLHYEFTDGLGSELDALARGDFGVGAWWEETFRHTGATRHPYVYEASGAQSHADLIRFLGAVRGNRKMVEAAVRARRELLHIAKHLEPDVARLVACTGSLP